MKIGFYFFLIIQKVLSLLSYRALYMVSDFMFFIMYHVVGYRKEVVYNNMKNSFPEKTDAEIRLIRKKFYHSFGDILVESIKLVHANGKQLSKRMTYKNSEIITDLLKANKSIIAIGGHTGNWELGGVFFPYVFNTKTFAIYQQLSNPYFDGYIKRMRSRFGVTPVTMQQSFRKFVEHKNELTVNLVVGDQAPPQNGDHYWTTFLNQETAFYTGTEKMAKTLDYAVVFMPVNRIKRGYYEAEVHFITDKPKETAEHEITEKYVRALEEFINKNPENWLWSHRRWKRKRINN